jgi:hypothetical protein
MGFMYDIKYKYSMKFVENLFPNILAWAEVWITINWDLQARSQQDSKMGNDARQQN